MMNTKALLLPKHELRISITSRCNMRCVYCHNEGNSQDSELDLDDILRIINAASEYGLKSVRLTGGEPLLHSDIRAICKALALEYGLKVGINTNGILIDRLLPLINDGLVTRVVVGIDYYDHCISKWSPVGVSSHTILENVLKIRDAGCDVCIDVVYQGDYENVAKIVHWGLVNRIRIKILEEVKPNVYKMRNPDYESMRQSLFQQFNIRCVKDELGEINGYVGTFRAVSFLHSFCRLRDCETCRQFMPLRITADGTLKPCIINSTNDINLFEIGLKNGFETVLQKYSCR